MRIRLTQRLVVFEVVGQGHGEPLLIIFARDGIEKNAIFVLRVAMTLLLGGQILVQLPHGDAAVVEAMQGRLEAAEYQV